MSEFLRAQILHLAEMLLSRQISAERFLEEIKKLMKEVT